MKKKLKIENYKNLKRNQFQNKALREKQSQLIQIALKKIMKN